MCLCFCTSAQRLGENVSGRRGTSGCEPVLCADVPTPHSVELGDPEKMVSYLPDVSRCWQRERVLMPLLSTGTDEVRGAHKGTQPPWGSSITNHHIPRLWAVWRMTPQTPFKGCISSQDVC